MGKGDIKTKKGKRHIGSFGKHRPHKRPPTPKGGNQASASAGSPKGDQKKSSASSKEEPKSS